MARNQYLMTEEVIIELTMGSDSDMEPEEEDFLPNGNDCVAGSCNETLLGEPAVFFCVKKVWKVCTKLSPFSTWLLFFFFKLP